MWERVPLLFSSCSVGILCVCCSCSLGWMSFWEGCHLLWPSLERGSISVQGWWANSWLSALRTRGWDLTDFTPTFNPRCPSFRKRKKEEKLLGLWPIFITLISYKSNLFSSDWGSESTHQIRCLTLGLFLKGYYCPWSFQSFWTWD